MGDREIDPLEDYTPIPSEWVEVASLNGFGIINGPDRVTGLQRWYVLNEQYALLEQRFNSAANPDD